jgi:hypothetical protein
LKRQIIEFAFTLEDLLKYLGIRLVMAAEGRHRRISSYWSTEKEEDSVFEHPR